MQRWEDNRKMGNKEIWGMTDVKQEKGSPEDAEMGT